MTWLESDPFLGIADVTWNLPQTLIDPWPDGYLCAWGTVTAYEV